MTSSMKRKRVPKRPIFVFGPKKFSEWKPAHNEAQKRANKTGLDVVIRKTTPFGKLTFDVSFASKNDSDYALGEIVRPE